MRESIMYVGLDQHKESIEIATADEGRDGEVRRYGRVDGELSSFARVVRKLTSTGKELQFVYEAGPCGYHLYRYLRGQGLQCSVVAPSLVPKKRGDRVKTDRRDAVNLARLARAGELTAVYVPEIADEAIRDLSRAREDAKRGETRARQQLLGLLLRHGLKYDGKTTWTQAHLRWLARVKLPERAQQIAFQEYVDAITEAAARVERLTTQLRMVVADWRCAPLVEALQALRGVSFITAAITVAEIGDLTRFTPRQLMAFLGLVPSEYSSGSRRHLGAITKAGNGHLRRVLIESAWAYRLPARVTRTIRARQEHLPQAVREISWRAQLRLCARYRHLSLRGKTKQLVVTAIARELIVFMWAIAREVKISS
jgi:transposase